MPSKVTHLTKIVDVKEVEFLGTLKHDYDEGWTIKNEPISDWLWKLKGKTVRLTIKNITRDESEMLNRTEEESADVQCGLCHGSGFAGCGAGDGLNDGVYCPRCAGSGRVGG